MTKPNSTFIGIVIDRSGSMSGLRTDVIGGFNQFLADQKKIPGYARVTMTQFDHEYKVLYSNVSITEVQPLTPETYEPRGSTALLDAVGRTVNSIGAHLASLKESDRPNQVIMLIMTDGEENSSVEFNLDQIKSMIEHQRSKYQWEFVFIGANQDSFASASALGMNANNSYTYAANSVGVQNLFAATSKGMTSYRGGGLSQVDDFWAANPVIAANPGESTIVLTP